MTIIPNKLQRLLNDPRVVAFRYERYEEKSYKIDLNWSGSDGGVSALFMAAVDFEEAADKLQNAFERIEAGDYD